MQNFIQFDSDHNFFLRKLTITSCHCTAASKPLPETSVKLAETARRPWGNKSLPVARLIAPLF